MRVLLVEDDLLLGKATRKGLEHRGYTVDWIRDGVSAETAVASTEYAAILLDLGLPKQDGLTVLTKLRKRGATVPVLVITARDEIADRVGGLDLGADDFIVKPFDLDELAARIRASVRRANHRPQSHLLHGTLDVDPASRTVVMNGVTIPLTAHQFALLVQLLEARGQVMSKAKLEESLYGWGEEIESNTVEVYIHHLRRKLGKDLIKTIHGAGYIIEAPADGH
jgi:two-component system, OmpR family, response regulator QseB